jgi:hypothetical protein
VSVLLKINGLLYVLQFCRLNLERSGTQAACINTCFATMILALCYTSYLFRMLQSCYNILHLLNVKGKIPLKKKGRGKFSVSMPWMHVGGRGDVASLLNLGTTWRWVVSFTSWPLYPRGYSGKPCIGGWVDPDFGEYKLSCSLWDLNHRFLTHSHYTDYAIADPTIWIQLKSQDNLKIGLKIGLEGVGSSHVAEDRDKKLPVMNTALSFRGHFQVYKTLRHLPTGAVANSSFRHEL